MSTEIAAIRDPYILFSQDLITDEREFPIMFREGLDPIWEVVLKDTPDPREPDIVTARTKAFLVGWKKSVPLGECSDVD